MRATFEMQGGIEAPVALKSGPKGHFWPGQKCTFGRPWFRTCYDTEHFSVTVAMLWLTDFLTKKYGPARRVKMAL